MDNPYDQFDAPSAAGNPYDQFDEKPPTSGPSWPFNAARTAGSAPGSAGSYFGQQGEQLAGAMANRPKTYNEQLGENFREASKKVQDAAAMLKGEKEAPPITPAARGEWTAGTGLRQIHAPAVESAEITAQPGMEGTLQWTPGDPVKNPTQGGIEATARALSDYAAGAAGQALSPVTAAVRQYGTLPLEHVTGIPAEKTEEAAKIVAGVIPGLWGGRAAPLEGDILPPAPRGAPTARPRQAPTIEGEVIRAEPREGLAPNVRLLRPDVPHDLPPTGRSSLGAASAGRNPLADYTPEQIAAGRRVLAESGLDNPHMLDQALDEASAHQTLGELTEGTEEHLGGIYAADQGAAKNTISQTLKERAKEAPEREAAELDRVFGENQNTAELHRQIEADRARTSSPFWRTFTNTVITPTDDLRDLQSRLKASGALQAANKAMAEEGLSATNMFEERVPGEFPGETEIQTEMLPSAAAYQYAKEHLDARIQSAIDASDANTARRITKLKNDLVKAIDEHPDPDIAGVWKTARRNWQGPSEFLDAQKLGKKLLTGNVDREDIPFLTEGWSPERMEHLRIGLRSYLEGLLRANRSPTRTSNQVLDRVLAPGNMEKIRAVVETPEQAEALFKALQFEDAMHNAPGRIMYGSPTARRQAAAKIYSAEATQSGMIGRTVGKAAKFFHKPVRTATAEGLEAVKGHLDSKAEQAAADLRDGVARMLTTQGPERDALARALMGFEEPRAVPPAPSPSPRPAPASPAAPSPADEIAARMRQMEQEEPTAAAPEPQPEIPVEAEVPREKAPSHLEKIREQLKGLEGSPPADDSHAGRVIDLVQNQGHDARPAAERATLERIHEGSSQGLPPVPKEAREGVSAAPESTSQARVPTGANEGQPGSAVPREALPVAGESHPGGTQRGNGPNQGQVEQPLSDLERMSRLFRDATTQAEIETETRARKAEAARMLEDVRLNKAAKAAQEVPDARYDYQAEGARLKEEARKRKEERNAEAASTQRRKEEQAAAKAARTPEEVQRAAVDFAKKTGRLEQIQLAARLGRSDREIAEMIPSMTVADVTRVREYFGLPPGKGGRPKPFRRGGAVHRADGGAADDDDLAAAMPDLPRTPSPAEQWEGAIRDQRQREARKPSMGTQIADIANNTIGILGAPILNQAQRMGDVYEHGIDWNNPEEVKQISGGTLMDMAGLVGGPAGAAERGTVGALGGRAPRAREQIGKIRELIADGKTFAQVADELGITRSSISGIVRTEGIEVPPKRAPRGYWLEGGDGLKELRRQNEEGATVDQMAQHFGVSENTIWSRMSENGIELKNSRTPGAKSGSAPKAKAKNISEWEVGPDGTLTRTLRKRGGRVGDLPLITRKQSNYAPDRGKPDHHCGPDKQWSTGFCAKFRGPHKCTAVAGFIATKGGCDWWQSADRQDRADGGATFDERFGGDLESRLASGAPPGLVEDRRDEHLSDEDAEMERFRYKMRKREKPEPPLRDRLARDAGVDDIGSRSADTAGYAAGGKVKPDWWLKAKAKRAAKVA